MNGEAGKGDRDRTTNFRQRDINYDRIDWSKKAEKKSATTCGICGRPIEKESYCYLHMRAGVQIATYCHACFAATFEDPLVIPIPDDPQP